MAESTQKAEIFRTLHVPGRPLVLFNIWDAGSAKAVTRAGALAIATGSWSVAAANGLADAEHVPLDLVIDNLTRIVGATDLPVSVDIESGYGQKAAAVGRTVERTIRAGAIGCNLEDSFPESGKLRLLAEQTERIQHARKAADTFNLPYFINARTDVFFQKPPKEHDDTMVAEAIERARAYADAGASGIFAPGLVDPKLIARLARGSPLPLNIMVSDSTTALEVLTDAGVARVSYGPTPYLSIMKTLEEIARVSMSAWTRT